MRHRLRITLAAVLVAAAGCSNPFGCDEERRVIEVNWGGAFEEIERSILSGYQQQGYDCTGESIRNGLGRQIGTKYTCTRCS